MKKILFLFCLLVSVTTFGGTSGICFVHQPLHTVGTDQDSDLVVARIPVISNAVPEDMIGYISSKNKLLQREPPFAEDSNILSCLNIATGAEWISDSRHFVVTLDLSRMKPAKSYGVTDEAVITAAIKCIKLTIDEIGTESRWKIRIKPGNQDGAKWARFETDYSKPHK